MKGVCFPLILLLSLLISLSGGWAQETATLPDDADTVRADSVSADSTRSDSLLTDSLSTTPKTVWDSVHYAADSIRYEVLKKMLSLDFNASLTYGSTVLQADSIRIDMERERAAALGQSMLRDGTHLILGDRILFDIANKEGMILQGATKFEQGYYYGAAIRKVGEDVYDIDDGYFTTCEDAEPGFYIYSRDMRLYRDDKIVAKPIIMFVNHFPILALPFGTISIKRGRQSGILIAEPGYNKYDGKYIKNLAYFQTYGPWANFETSFDYMEKTGWEGRFESVYKKHYNFDGRLFVRYQERVVSAGQQSNQWEIDQRHNQEIGYASKFSSNLHFVSSRAIWESSVETDERLSESVTSSMSFNTPLWDRNLYIYASYTDDLIEKDKDITLPSISWSLPTKQFYEMFLDPEDVRRQKDKDAWYTNFSYSYSLRGVHIGSIKQDDPTLADIFYETKQDSSGAYINQHLAGMRHSAGIRHSYKVLGWLSLSQNVNLSGIIHDRDRDGESWARGWAWDANSSASFSVYGLQRFEDSWLKAVRHIVTPRVSYRYTPDFSENDRFYNFGGVGVSSGKMNRNFGFSLENQWQIKYRAGEDGTEERKINNLLRVTSTSSYNIETEKFADISHSASFSPGSYDLGIASLNWRNTGSVTQNSTYWHIDRWRVTTVLGLSGELHYTEYFPRPLNRFESNRFFTEEEDGDDSGAIESIEELEMTQNREGWSFNLTHDYSRSRNSDRFNSTLRLSMGLKLTKHWDIEYSDYIDLYNEKVISHTLTIVRTLSCWKLRFHLTRSGDFWDYKLTIFNIKLPNALKFETSEKKH